MNTNVNTTTPMATWNAASAMAVHADACGRAVVAFEAASAEAEAAFKAYRIGPRDDAALAAWNAAYDKKSEAEAAFIVARLRLDETTTAFKALLGIA